MTRALALALLVLALAGCGGNDPTPEESAATQPVTVTETVTHTETVVAEPEVACSTSGLRLTLPEQDLPPEVADVRRRVFDAAVACDYDTLQEIALEQGEGFTYSYGGDSSAAEFWRALESGGLADPGPPPMRALAAILALPYTRNETGSYAWPTAYSESPTETDWQALVAAGLYTQEQIDSMREMAGAGGYLGYRTAITADGDWQFFVAGD